MGPLTHLDRSALAYVVDDAAGLAEFDSESGAAISLSRSRVPALLRDLGTFSVVEQYEPADVVGWPETSSVPPWWAAMKTASAAALVVVTTGTPLGTELPERGSPARIVETAQPISMAVPASTAAPVTAALAEPKRRSRPATTSSKPAAQAPSEVRSEPPAVPPTTPPSELELASLRRAFASLNGPFMTFEHCEVRLASPDRALARCQGTGSEASAANGLSRRRVEWTLDFDRASERWLIVDAAAR